MPKHLSSDGDATRLFKIAVVMLLAVLAAYFACAALIADEAALAGKVLLWSLAGLLTLAALIAYFAWLRGTARSTSSKVQRSIAAAILHQRWIRTVAQIIPDRVHPHRRYEVYSLTTNSGLGWFFCWLGGDPTPMVAKHSPPSTLLLYTPSRAGILEATAHIDDTTPLTHLLKRHHASDCAEGMTTLSPSATRVLFRELRLLRGRPTKQIS